MQLIPCSIIALMVFLLLLKMCDEYLISTANLMKLLEEADCNEDGSH